MPNFDFVCALCFIMGRGKKLSFSPCLFILLGRKWMSVKRRELWQDWEEVVYSVLFSLERGNSSKTGDDPVKGELGGKEKRKLIISL